MDKTKIDVTSRACLMICIIILLLPLKLVAAWGVSILLHETFHLIALRLFRCNINNITIDAFGVKIDTEPLLPHQELVCSIAGPLSGFVLLAFIRVFPLVSIMGLMHTMYNLIPIYPLDGGRSVRCIYRKIFGESRGLDISLWSERIILFIIVLFLIGVMIRFGLGVFSLFIWLFVLYKRRK